MINTPLSYYRVDEIGTIFKAGRNMIGFFYDEITVRTHKVILSNVRHNYQRLESFFFFCFLSTPKNPLRKNLLEKMGSVKSENN